MNSDKEGNSTPKLVISINFLRLNRLRKTEMRILSLLGKLQSYYNYNLN